MKQHEIFFNTQADIYKSFFSAETEFGNVGLKNGKAFYKMVYGNPDVKKIVVSGVEQNL